MLLAFFAGCATNSGTGPQYQSNNGKIAIENAEPFDISIGVFNPGLSDQSSYGEAGIWPELRRAESMYMAVQLRDVLANSKNFGAVKVAPDLSSSADLYIKAKILQSNGEDVSLKVTVIDSTGKQWISKLPQDPQTSGKMGTMYPINYTNYVQKSIGYHPVD